jgi:hypothetical protein
VNGERFSLSELSARGTFSLSGPAPDIRKVSHAFVTTLPDIPSIAA